MSEFTQIFIDLSGLRWGGERLFLKGWGLKAMMSELTQIFIDSDFSSLLFLKKKHHL